MFYATFSTLRSLDISEWNPPYETRKLSRYKVIRQAPGHVLGIDASVHQLEVRVDNQSAIVIGFQHLLFKCFVFALAIRHSMHIV